MSQKVASQPILGVNLRRTYHCERVICQSRWVLLRAICRGWVKNSMIKRRLNAKNSSEGLKMNMVNTCELKATKL